MRADCELLGLAAKAVGAHWLNPYKEEWLESDNAETWNPWKYDDDTFRLAVKLQLEIEHNNPLDNSLYVCVSRCGIEMVRDPVRIIEEFEDESERTTATRRAIVRAAAEIGKEMP